MKKLIILLLVFLWVVQVVGQESKGFIWQTEKGTIFLFAQGPLPENYANKLRITTGKNYRLEALMVSNKYSPQNFTLPANSMIQIVDKEGNIWQSMTDPKTKELPSAMREFILERDTQIKSGQSRTFVFLFPTYTPKGDKWKSVYLFFGEEEYIELFKM